MSEQINQQFISSEHNIEHSFEQTGQPSTSLPHSITDESVAWSASRRLWKEHWKAEGQSWRTEPEIDNERKKYLCHLIYSTIDLGEFGNLFWGEVLSRADVEWLIIPHGLAKE